MCLVLVSHLLLRREAGQPVRSRQRVIRFIISAFIFGLGVSFRWNAIAYLLAMVVDIWGGFRGKSILASTRILSGLGWGAGALVFSILMIVVSGTGYADVLGQIHRIQDVVHQSGTAGPGVGLSLGELLLRTGLTLSPLFTPAFILFSAIGFCILIRTRNSLWIMVLAGLLGVAPWIRSGVPKFIITLLPGLVLCFVVGFASVSDHINRKRTKSLYYFAISLLVFGPWVVGIHVLRPGTAWGPGFELRPYAFEDTDSIRFEPSLDAGAAFPTSEGPRPLFGHGFVLLGGEWRRFARERAMERDRVIDHAIVAGIPLVVTSWSPDFYLDILYARGYSIADSIDNRDESGYFAERRFIGPDGEYVTLLFHEVESGDLNGLIQQFAEWAYPAKKVLFVGYSQTLRSLYQIYPDSLEPIGSTSAILDIGRLTRSSKLTTGIDQIPESDGIRYPFSLAASRRI